MAYEENLVISGVTSTGLVAGPEASGGSATRIYIRNSDGVQGELDDGAVIRGGYLYVSNGGVANNARMDGGARFYVYVGGVANDTAISGGQAHIVGGVANLTTVNSTGNLHVSNGGVANETTVNNGGNLYVSNGGVANETTVNNGGKLYVSGGGVANLTTVNQLGALTVFSGGEAKWAYVSRGSMYISSGGVTNSATLDGGARVYVSVGGAANETTVVGGQLHIQGGAADNTTISGQMHVSNGGKANTAVMAAGGQLTVSVGGQADDVVMNGGTITVNDGGTATIAYNPWSKGTVTSNTGADVTYLDRNAGVYYGGATPGLVSRGDVLTELAVETGNSALVFSGGNVNSATVLGGQVHVSNGGAVNDTTISAGYMNVSGGGTANSTTISAGGNLYVYDSGVANLTTVSNAGNLYVSDGGKAISTTLDKTGYMRVYTGGSAEGAVIASGSMYVSTGGSAKYVTLASGRLFVDGGLMESTTVLGGRMSAYAGGVASSTLVSKSYLHVANNGTAKDTIVMIGGAMSMDGGATEGTITFDLTGATGNTGSAMINDLTRVTAGTTLSATISAWSANDYLIATTGDATRSIIVTDGSATATLADGDAITNPFAGASYTWNGAKLDGEAYSFTATATAAAALSTDTAASINGGDLAVKWTSATAFSSGSVYLAGATANGKTAWVELDGYEGGAGTTLYGAQGDAFASGTVNINAKSGSLRNLAAGANAGGTVKAVNLTFAGAELDGTGYAGGFGNVTGKTATTITTGTFAKDFYAGALANKLTTTTSVGSVSMTVAGGTFDGNIYGASAVKTDSTKGTGTRHTAGDVTLTVTGGSTTKGAQACIFAGGYATGTATGTVYKVDSVTATISGGSWGEAAGGRGVFGGIMASGVEAQVLGAVNITISGDATMGNVYGGGWAQKTGGKSIVGDVNINIAGGTIANVFGGGTHSTSGGSTESGDITITVSGGDITGTIYAKGQLDGDTTGAAKVIFTGAADFDCDVFGYSYVGGAASDAHLSYSDYTGEFAGAIGGFNSITFDGATAMTLDTAANDISNGAWEFDFTERDASLSGSSLLTWSGADFTKDTIKVTFADDTQAQGGWNIATVAEAFSETTFDVEIGGEGIASGLAYNQQIVSGDYAGWGFELESGVLKFKQLA